MLLIELRCFSFQFLKTKLYSIVSPWRHRKRQEVKNQLIGIFNEQEVKIHGR